MPILLAWKPDALAEGIDHDVLDQPLVDSELEGIPRLASLAAGRLPGSDFEGFGLDASVAFNIASLWIPSVCVTYRKTDGALDCQALGLGALDELAADFFEGRDLATREGDSDAVHLLQRLSVLRHGIYMCPPLPSRTHRLLANVLLVLLMRHFEDRQDSAYEDAAVT